MRNVLVCLAFSLLACAQTSVFDRSPTLQPSTRYQHEPMLDVVVEARRGDTLFIDAYSIQQPAIEVSDTITITNRRRIVPGRYDSKWLHEDGYYMAAAPHDSVLVWDYGRWGHAVQVRAVPIYWEVEGAKGSKETFCIGDLCTDPVVRA